MNFNVNTNTAPITFYWDHLVQIDVPAPEGDQMDLPVTFDDANVNYGIVGFEGAEAAIVAGPVDAANQVGQVTKGPESGTSAGATVTSLPGGPAGFASPIPFAASATTMSVRVWSPTANIPVRLKVENADNSGITVETEAMVTVAAAWDTLVFDFAEQVTGTAALNLSSVYNKASIFFDFGNVSAASTNYFFDDMMFGGAGGGTGVLPVTLPVDFESTELTYDFGGFQGADPAIETNPDQTGENTSATVMRTTKTDGAEFFAGTFLNLDEPIDFSVNKGISIQSWSPKTGIPVRIRLEDSGNTAGIEIDVNTTVASSWETLTADFTSLINPAINYVRVVVFYEFVEGLAGDGTTYYFDNIEVVEAGGGGDDTQMDLPVTFDEEGIDYGLDGFGNANGAVVVDPTDATNMVGEVIKSAGAEVWAGVTMTSTSGGPGGFASRIPFAADATTITVRTWSPAADINVLLKAEKNDDAAVSVETNAMTTVAGGWETLTFDFANEAMGTAALDLNAVYDKLSIFFDFGNQPAEEATYYFDDVYFGDFVSTNEPLTGILEAFPNPVGNEFNIVAPERMESLILFSGKGRKVGEWQPNSERFTLAADHLAPGMYVALVRTARGLMTIKVVKE